MGQRDLAAAGRLGEVHGHPGSGRVVLRHGEGEDQPPRPLDEASAWIDEQRRLWTWRLGELDRIMKEQSDG